MYRFTLPVGLFVLIGLAVWINQLNSEQQASVSNAPVLNASALPLDANMVKCQVNAIFDFSVRDDDQPLSVLFDNLGNHNYKVSTKSKEAQQFFNQGLSLVYAFNHAEAHRSFREAARLDPDLAMAWWGQAYALGPNINDPAPTEERNIEAYEASQKAFELMLKASKKEQAIIQALTTRVDEDPSADRQELNAAYMAAMTEVVKNYAKDADIQTLYAAAVMNTMPWNYWDEDMNPNPGIGEAKAALETAMEINPEHAGAHHYYIHMVELPDPDKAEASADELGGLMPAAGHLVHMPSHIYIRVGRYRDARIANQQAIEADEDYISQCLSQGIYPLGYYPHNIHFLWSAASMEGMSGVAIDAAEKVADKIPALQAINMPFIQDFLSTPLLAYVRFGKWNEVLTTPHPGAEAKHVMIIWHYSRGIAFLRKGEIEEAKEELEALEPYLKDEELENILANYTNPSSKIAPVAYYVLAGEVAAAESQWDSAFEHLQKALSYEDALTYSEPQAWHIPVRQTLGSKYLEAGKYEEAEQIFQEDLKKNRENGWSLYGLQASLKGQGKQAEAGEAMARYKEAWKEADIEITSSIL